MKKVLLMTRDEIIDMIETMRELWFDEGELAEAGTFEECAYYAAVAAMDTVLDHIEAGEPEWYEESV